MPDPITIRYPLHEHLKATATDHPRFGLALILRAARGGDEVKVWAMVNRLCEEYNLYKWRTAVTLSQQEEARLYAQIGKDLCF